MGKGDRPQKQDHSQGESIPSYPFLNLQKYSSNEPRDISVDAIAQNGQLLVELDSTKV